MGALGSCVGLSLLPWVPVAAEGTEQGVAAPCVWNIKHCPGKVEIHPRVSPAGCRCSEPRAGTGSGMLLGQHWSHEGLTPQSSPPELKSLPGSAGAVALCSLCQPQPSSLSFPLPQCRRWHNVCPCHAPGQGGRPPTCDSRTENFSLTSIPGRLLQPRRFVSLRRAVLAIFIPSVHYL